MNARVDHLVWGVPDVDAAVKDLAAALGVMPAAGGRHPSWGTKNALLSLGPGTYLEILGPDPEAPSPDAARPLGLDDLEAPDWVGWAAAVDDLERAAEIARAHGFDPGTIAERSRVRADGVRLAWRMTDIGKAGGPVPFLLDWGSSPHPSASAPGGCTLASFRVETPAPEPLRALFQALGFDVPVAAGDVARLAVEIAAPAGIIAP